MILEANNRQWIIGDRGITQLNPKPFVYDENYCSTYDTIDYLEGEKALQASRLGFIIGAYGAMPKTILDFGCGNYAFLKTAQKVVPFCFGYDLAHVPPPPRIGKVPQFTDPVDVVTFHDSLEHCPDPTEVIKALSCNMVVISCPNCDYETKGAEWFLNDYYHLKPDEHLWHWSAKTLQYFMRGLGWLCVAQGHHEDIVRSRGTENILTMAFKPMQHKQHNVH